MSVDDIFNERDAGLFMWELCQWICKQGESSTTYYWHDILTNSELHALMSSDELVNRSYLERDNIYRPFLRRILEGLSERGFFREDKTGEANRVDGEEIIEYTPTAKLNKNCPKFLKYVTANIDDPSLQLDY
ncbi:MAG: hypothetical protein WAK17_21440 [Candidatus Nitrosopolaris sp.]|jgi:hypothetical protein